MYYIYDGAGNVADVSESQVQAFRLLDWLTANDTANGPFHCALASAEVAA